MFYLVVTMVLSGAMRRGVFRPFRLLDQYITHPLLFFNAITVPDTGRPYPLRGA